MFVAGYDWQCRRDQPYFPFASFCVFASQIGKRLVIQAEGTKEYEMMLVDEQVVALSCTRVSP